MLSPSAMFPPLLHLLFVLLLLVPVMCGAEEGRATSVRRRQAPGSFAGARRFRGGVDNGGAVRRGAPAAHRARAFHRWVGQDLVLLCQTTGSTWRRNGGPLPSAAESGATGVGRRLVIRRATLRDSALYTCGSEGRAVVGAAYVFIHARPQVPGVTVIPNQVNVSEGMSVELRCVATGVPQPAVVWNLSERLFSSRVTVDGNKLQIHNVAASDSGMYSCIATNREGKYYEAISTVIVGEQRKAGGDEIRTDPRLITVLPEKYNAPVGSTVILRCNTVAAVDSAVQWNKGGGGEIPPGATYTKGNRELIITNAQVNDSGVYYCVAWHKSGKYYVQASSNVDIGQGV